MRFRGIYPGSAFLLVLLGTALFLLNRELVSRRGGRGPAEPRYWVCLSDPGLGARFHSFECGDCLGDLVKRALPQLADRLSDSCKLTVLEAGTQIHLQKRLGSEDRTCFVSPLPERYRYLMGMPLNVNRAKEEELELLPGIGPRLANRIIQFRQRIGCFSSPDDLLQVPGIGQRILRRMQRHLCFGTVSGCPIGDVSTGRDESDV